MDNRVAVGQYRASSFEPTRYYKVIDAEADGTFEIMFLDDGETWQWPPKYIEEDKLLTEIEVLLLT